MKLLKPIMIGNLEIRNRIVMPAMVLGYCKDGYISDRIISFYRERAQGGAGLIVIGGCSVDPYPAYLDMVQINDDTFIPGHRQLADTVKQAGARVCAQLFQAGRYASSSISGIQPIAPSPIPSTMTRETPREMTQEDIEGVINDFAAAACRVKEAGYDMVELIGSAGYLISQFFSPITNQRSDEYGGNMENRSRFGVELVKAVRQAVGSGFPIMMRLNGHEFMPGGNTNREIQYFAQQLQKAGVDAFDVNGGWHESKVPQITTHVPPGAYAYLAQGIKRTVDVPVVACNRVNDPWVAETILIQDQADMVGIARGLMADPEFPKKVMEGRFREIRKCIGCNQGCLDNLFQGKSCACLVNARAGREDETEIKPVSSPRRVLVIGGGVAGMEAARVAALRGHRVTLWEKSDRLGGQLLLAGAVPDRADLLNLVDYLKESLNVLSVEVVLNKEAGVEEVKGFEPEAVVVATGARPIVPPIPGIELGMVVDGWKIINEPVELGRRVVIIGGGAVGCELGLHIAKMGTIDSNAVSFLLLNEAESVETIKELATRGSKEVVILEMEKSAGRGLGVTTRWVVMQDLARMGVKINTNTAALAIVPEGVLVSRKDNQQDLLYADTVVIAAGAKSENVLYEELRSALPEVYLAGDAVSPRTALEAVREGFDVGYSI